MNTFGARLKFARKKARLSQQEVAARIGTKQPLISELENDEYQTSGFTPRLAHLYKVNARWLAEGKGPMDVTATELLDDEELISLLHRYISQDDATKALVQHLLREDGHPMPTWMTTGTAAAIENARQLVQERMKASPKELDQ
mgnify:CR=1 FL=1